MKETMKTKLCAVLIQAGNYLVRLKLCLVTILTLILLRVAWLIVRNIYPNKEFNMQSS
jgi:hypothetical protein